MPDDMLTPDLLLQAYRVGIFPMSETRDSDEVFWVDPRHRGVFPLDGFHLSRSLKRRLRRAEYRVTFNHDFAAVVTGCANRDETWINDTIFDLYVALHESGDAHSCEVWKDAQLVGGVYGVTIGGAFFGESMFSTATDASKVALAYLIDRLRLCEFALFDTQFLTDHLASLGAVEISRAAYHQKLESALRLTRSFHATTQVPSAQDLIQRSTQTS